MPKVDAPTPARFTGFADRDARFFRALAKNQRRDWFEAHRREYEDGWLHPMKALLAEIRDRIDPLFPYHPLREPKVFRIHRDVRFSKDKSPYKTHIGGYVALDGGGDREGPSGLAAVYVHVGAGHPYGAAQGEVFVASGQYAMDPPQLARFRVAVAEDRRGSELAAIVRRLTRAGFAPGAHQTLQRVPRGFDPGHPRADLLKRKGLVVSYPAPPRALLVSPKLVDWIADHTRRTAPLVAWLAALTDSD